MDIKIEPHIIIHLKITEDDINNFYNNRIGYPNIDINKDTLPRPYEPYKFEKFSSLDEKKEKTAEIENKKDDETKYFLNMDNVNIDEYSNIPVESIDENSECTDVKIKLIKAMVEFSEANKRNEWPLSTSIYCKWCVHPFSGIPISIPKIYLDNTFFVSGCYCSFSCAAAHLFFRGDYTKIDKTNYYNLLHLLKQKMLNKDNLEKIRVAPSQDILKIFGGHLSVEEFRNITKESCNDYKIYSILEPSIVSIIPSIEETVYSDPNDKRILNNHLTRTYNDMKYVEPQNENYISMSRWGKKKSFIPVDKDRMDRAVKNLKIKRTAPLLNKKKTLLNYMNLTVNNRSEQL